ncbi:MAG TPA: single-stranded-DNA-specific exonuclease RecJ [Geobacteraceae bacterium]
MEPIRNRRWRLREPDTADVDAIARRNGVPSIVARVIANRGIIEPDAAARFFFSTLADVYDPFLLLGMEEAVARLAAAIVGRQKVCVYGDYDVDGITSVALLVSFLRAVGGDVFYYIPRRLEEGYGLCREGIEQAAARGAAVIVTVDCGITATAEAELCTACGIDLIITDHHTPGASLPKATAIINPLQPGCGFPFKSLAGVGLAFNLALALRSRLRTQGVFQRMQEPNLREYLDFVALGTVADVVPLVDENRIFVRYGLKELTSSSRPGVMALKKVAGVEGEVTCGMVGFRLAPRLNAAGRLEDAAPGVELLLTDDPRLAQAYAAELDAGNAERQAIEQEILRDALEMVQGTPALRGRKSIVLASEEWHPGVIGIVASRLVDIFHRPTILIALKEGNGRGSGRSIPAFHLYDALHTCSEHLIKFGGHKYAAGLAIEEATLASFVEMFDAVAHGHLTPDDLTPELAIDAVLSPGEITLDLAQILETLTPFGMGNPEPVFMLRRATVVERRILKEKHVKLKMDAGGSLFEAIGFNMAPPFHPGDVVELAFTLQTNEWRGKKDVQLRMRDVRKAGNN